MRALVATRIDRIDPLSVLEFRDEWPQPVPPPGWTIVRVAATSINAHDLWSIRGVGIRPEQFPMVLGCDAASARQTDPMHELGHISRLSGGESGHDLVAHESRWGSGSHCPKELS
jgi:hypothetical protein